MVATELQVEHVHVRPLMIRMALILIRICGVFVRLRPALCNDHPEWVSRKRQPLRDSNWKLVEDHDLYPS